MERSCPKYLEPDLKLFSSKKETSGELIKVRNSEKKDIQSVFRVEPFIFRLNNSSIITENLGMGDLEQVNDAFLSLVNTSDMIVVPTNKDGVNLANFCAEFTDTYKYGYNLGSWGSARENVEKKTYALGGYINDEKYTRNYFMDLRSEHRADHLGKKQKGINFYIISDVVANSPIFDVVEGFANEILKTNLPTNSLSIYSNLSNDLLNLSKYVDSLPPKARESIKLNISCENTQDFIDKAIAVGDVYVGLSNYESYSNVLYKSIYAGKGLILPKNESVMEIAGREVDQSAVYVNPHFTASVIGGMRSITNNQNTLSQMMINNLIRGNHFSLSEYDKRLKMAVVGGIPSVWELRASQV